MPERETAHWSANAPIATRKRYSFCAGKDSNHGRCKIDGGKSKDMVSLVPSGRSIRVDLVYSDLVRDDTM